MENNLDKMNEGDYEFLFNIIIPILFFIFLINLK